MSRIWVSSAVLWARKAQQWRKERASEQERGCVGKVRRPACVLRLSAVLLYFNTEQRVCRNRQSRAGLTHNLVKYQQNTDIFDQKHKEVIKLATLWVKTVRRTSKYLPEVPADSQGHTEEVINQRQWQTLHWALAFFNCRHLLLFLSKDRKPQHMKQIYDGTEQLLVYSPEQGRETCNINESVIRYE